MVFPSLAPFRDFRNQSNRSLVPPHNLTKIQREGRPTSEIPLRCWRRKRTVHAMRRGFLRWRKRDSDFPLKKRKILLSPRTNSLPCNIEHQMLASNSEDERAEFMCGGSVITESDNCNGFEKSKVECRIRVAVVSSHTNSSQKRRQD